LRILDKLKEKLFGKRETIPCVCGGEMVRQDTPIPDPYHPSFVCESCGSWNDGVVFHPSPEFKETEEYERWRKEKEKELKSLT